MSKVLTNDLFLSQLKQHATIQMKKFTWAKSGVAALSCMERLVASQGEVSVNEIELPHLISAISSIKCKEMLSDNDLCSQYIHIDFIWFI